MFDVPAGRCLIDSRGHRLNVRHPDREPCKSVFVGSGGAASFGSEPAFSLVALVGEISYCVDHRGSVRGHDWCVGRRRSSTLLWDRINR